MNWQNETCKDVGKMTAIMHSTECITDIMSTYDSFKFALFLMVHIISAPLLHDFNIL